MGCQSSLLSCYNPCSREGENKEKEGVVISYSVALKLPHGLSYLEYIHDSGSFQKEENIDHWIANQFNSRTKPFQHYINYNDEHVDKTHSGGGHCKGCIAWNDEEIGWLIHSIPKMMVPSDHVSKTNHSFVSKAEQVYGQSLVFLSNIPISELPALLEHISVMKPFVDLSSSTSTIGLPNVSNTIPLVHFLPLSTSVEHVTKSPNYHVDLFDEILCHAYKGSWRCETWRRGHHCNTCPHVADNDSITFENVHYTSSQDHSKYAVNDVGSTFIGDLNRMTTQFCRGGGGVIIHDVKLNKAISSLMLSGS
uniref:Uncharacterized protein n=1 Tax=viral metagenome TaxID=1070528 RepID=A0A6C0I3U9_9ZZZZ